MAGRCCLEEASSPGMTHVLSGQLRTTHFARQRFPESEAVGASAVPRGTGNRLLLPMTQW